jgi:uncharacterized protein YbjT (DUF2867 family)
VILVAGATGHLGTALVELLNSRDAHVRVLSRDPERAGALFGNRFDMMQGDVRDASSLTLALTGVDTVISAVTGFGPGGGGTEAVDRRGNENLIAAAEAAGAKRFVLVSIHGARADHPLGLYRAKFFAEERLRESRLAWTIVRPTVFMELWAGIVGDSLVKSGKATVFGRGDNPINFVSVRDVARVIELAATADQSYGTTIDAGGPENLTLNEMVKVLAANSDRKAAARHIPLPALRVISVLLRPFRPDLAGLIQAAVLMDTADMSFDPAPAVEYAEVPATRLAEILRAERVLAQ